MNQMIARSFQDLPEPARGGYAAERWSKELEKLFTVFGRLVYLGSLLDPARGTFVHQGLELRCGKQRCRELIRDAYRRTLDIWLGYDRTRQEEEVRRYFAALEVDEPGARYLAE
jgi:hypothetical protein